MCVHRHIIEDKGMQKWDIQYCQWDDRDLEYPHLAPHDLLIPLDFLLWNGLLCDLARDIPRHQLGGGALRGREGERGSGERVGGNRDGRCGWASRAALSKGPLFWWYMSCRLAHCDQVGNLCWSWAAALAPCLTKEPCDVKMAVRGCQMEQS